MFSIFKKKKKVYPTSKFKIGDEVSWIDNTCGIIRNGTIIDYSISEVDVKYMFLDNYNKIIYEWIDEVELIKI